MMTKTDLAAALRMANLPFYTDNEVGITVRSLVADVTLLREKLEHAYEKIAALSPAPAQVVGAESIHSPVDTVATSKTADAHEAVTSQTT